MNREPSQDYRSLSPGSDESPDASGEDIPPLAFESEAELLSVLIRLRAGLAEDLRSKWEELMGDEDELKKAETIVLEQFFDQLAPAVFSNCTIGGQSYSEFKKHKAGDTQPFSEILHERVLKYQDGLFVARETNVTARKSLPIQTAHNLRKVLAADRDLLERMETENRLAFSRDIDEEESGGGRASKKRKAVNDNSVSQGPTKEQAEGDFAAGVQSIEELKNISKVIEDTQRAQAIAEDAGNLE